MGDKLRRLKRKLRKAIVLGDEFLIERIAQQIEELKARIHLDLVSSDAIYRDHNGYPCLP